MAELPLAGIGHSPVEGEGGQFSSGFQRGGELAFLLGALKLPDSQTCEEWQQDYHDYRGDGLGPEYGSRERHKHYSVIDPGLGRVPQRIRTEARLAK